MLEQALSTYPNHKRPDSKNESGRFFCVDDKIRK